MTRDHIVERFWHKRRAIGRLRARDEAFRDACDDYNQVVSLIADMANGGSDRDREDLSRIRRSLETEIVELLERQRRPG